MDEKGGQGWEEEGNNGLLGYNKVNQSRKRNNAQDKSFWCPWMGGGVNDKMSQRIRLYKWMGVTSLASDPIYGFSFFIPFVPTQKKKRARLLIKCLQ